MREAVQRTIKDPSQSKRARQVRWSEAGKSEGIAGSECLARQNNSEHAAGLLGSEASVEVADVRTCSLSKPGPKLKNIGCCSSYWKR